MKEHYEVWIQMGSGEWRRKLVTFQTEGGAKADADNYSPHFACRIRKAFSTVAQRSAQGSWEKGD